MQTRNEALLGAKDKTYDLAVIGGGIVGAGIAQNAACRGLSVILIDKGDFSSATSGKTTKLIHGGLRYLEQLQFGLTKELCRERALLEQLAPHLVRDFSFILPVNSKNRLFGFKAGLGLALYDFLSTNAKGTRKHERLTANDALAHCPALSPDKVSFGLRFHDCITNDARLVFELIKSAERSGANAINYLSAQDFQLENGRITAIHCRDRFSGQDVTIGCRTCINATGAFSDDVVAKLDSSWTKKLALSKGVHIMLPASAFPTNSALFLPTSDGRYVFAIPWEKALMVGTTDSPYDGSPDNPTADESEIKYLLDVVNEYARNDRQLGRQDVIAAWAGIRPLVGRMGSLDTRKLSREHQVFEAKGGMIAVIGGKLTNYRIVSDEVVNKVLEKLPSDIVTQLKPARTDTVMLGGWTGKDDYLTSSAEISAKARRVSIEPATIDHLLSSYGKDALKIVDIVESDAYLSKRVCPDFPPIMAEAVYSVKHEMALCLEDVLFRRMRLGLIHQGQCLAAASRVARCVQGVLGWDEVRTAAEVQAVTKTIQNNLNVQLVTNTESD